MTAPDDVNYIEFNLFPDDEIYSSSANKVSHVRSSLISAAWEKGFNGRYYVIEPSSRNHIDFYNNDIRVSTYEIEEVLKSLHVMIGDLLSHNIVNNSHVRHKPEEHTVDFIAKKTSKIKTSNMKKSVKGRTPKMKSNFVNPKMKLPLKRKDRTDRGK